MELYGWHILSDGLVPEYNAMRVYAFLPTFILFDIKELY